MKDQEYEPKFLGEKMTDFEKNLFLKRQVKELQEAIKKLLNREDVKNLNFRIGELESEIDELKYELKKKDERTYSGMNKAQKANFRHKMRDEFSMNQKKQIQILEGKIIERNQRIKELEEELKLSKL